MGRPKIKVISVSDSCITLNNVDVPRELWDILEQWSDHMRLSPLQTFWLFLNRVLGELKGRNPAFSEITAATHAKRGRVEADDGEDRSDSVTVKPKDLPNLEAYIGLLEVNDKATTGYVGVYPNGKAYRAMGPRQDGRGSRNAVHIGTYSTPEEAALARMLYYRRNKIVYGVWSVEVGSMMRNLHEMGRSDITFDDALEFVNETRITQGKQPIGITEDRILYVGTKPPPIAADADDASS